MPPFAGDGVFAGQHLAVYDDAAADSGAENNAENHGRTLGRAVRRFGYGETIGVIGQSHRTTDELGQVRIQGMADQAGGIGVFYPRRRRRQGAGNTDADARLRWPGAS